MGWGLVRGSCPVSWKETYIQLICVKKIIAVSVYLIVAMGKLLF